MCKIQRNDEQPLALCAMSCEHWERGAVETTCEPTLNGRTPIEWPSDVARFPLMLCSAHKALRRAGKRLQELPPVVYPSLRAWKASGAFRSDDEYGATLRQIKLEMYMLETQNAIVASRALDKRMEMPLDDEDENCNGFQANVDAVREEMGSLGDRIDEQICEWRNLSEEA